MGVHGGNNIDSVLFQFIPDAFLMQGSPGGSSVVEGDGDAVISSSQKLFFLLGEADAVRGDGVFTERTVVDDPGGITQNQLYICVAGQGAPERWLISSKSACEASSAIWSMSRWMQE